MTHDGRHESCRYWQFLERHGDLRPDQRKIFAQAAINAELDRMKKRGAKQASAAEAGPEPAGDEAEAREKPQETQQPALF